MITPPVDHSPVDHSIVGDSQAVFKKDLTHMVNCLLVNYPMFFGESSFW